MIIPKAIKHFYEVQETNLNLISTRLRETLFPYCEKCGHAYKQRTKSLESLFEKLESGRYKSITDIDDLVASTIIVATLNLEDKVLDYLGSVFIIDNVRKRNSTKKSPEAFRFDSTRVICKLKNFQESDETIYSIPFEIQILTSFEHAWQVTTHSLTYKSNEVDWKLLRLSAQLRASIEQLDMLVSSFSDIRVNVKESEWIDITIKRKIFEFVKNMSKQGKIAEEHLPKDLSRFSDNVHSLLNETIKGGTINDLNCVDTILKKLEGILSEEIIPKSLSLQQYFCIFLVKQNLIRRVKSSYNYLLTQEMLDIYPELGTDLKSMKRIAIK
jgi:ppGpp synthetase/RelA/SpoT-type nucleotidyltranferase